MRVRIPDLVKLVALCALSSLGCINAPGIIDQAPPDFFSFSASGTWLVEGRPGISYRFSSSDDGATVGDFTGLEYFYTDDEDRADEVTGHWEDNSVTFTVDNHSPKTYHGTLSSDNPNSLTVGGDGVETRELHR